LPATSRERRPIIGSIAEITVTGRVATVLPGRRADAPGVLPDSGSCRRIAAAIDQKGGEDQKMRQGRR